jgi:dCMP deaminase
MDIAVMQEQSKVIIPGKWDLRFIRLAQHIAEWSKDPSTKVGAVIVDQDKRVVSMGYNGFPRGVDDSPERYENREMKYPMICHSERNAVLFARQDLRGCILYTTFFPCAPCAGIIIQAGIEQVVTLETPPERAERWAKEILLASTMFKEAKVGLLVLPLM